MPKEKKGLGIGLDALFGSDEPEENELQTLPIAKVEPRMDQPREIFEEQLKKCQYQRIGKTFLTMKDQMKLH